MKKFFPLTIFAAVFTLSVIVHFISDYLKIEANQSTKEARQLNFYTQKFLKSKKLEEVGYIKSKAKVKILNFWASWCGPCLEEFQGLNKLSTQFDQSKLAIMGVNSDLEGDREKIVKKMTAVHKLKFPSVIDENAKIIEDFDVQNLPFSLLIVDNKVIEIFEGQVDFGGRKFISKIKNHL